MSFQRLSGLLNFNHSARMPCPYRAGKYEQQVFVELSGPCVRAHYNDLARAGFRRSHHIAYRPGCAGCNSCVPVRIALRDFKITRGWKRVIRRNAHLGMKEIGACDTDEQFALFSRYVKNRHWDGEMATMNRQDYRNLVTASPVDTTIFEFRDQKGRLSAACLADRLDDGLSAVYSFFDPALASNSPGSFIILKLVAHAQQQQMDYLYLGFWIKENRKMSYKSRFQPLEALHNSHWTPVD